MVKVVKVLYRSDAIQVLDSSLTFLRLGFSSWSLWYGDEFHGFLFLFDPRRRRHLMNFVSVLFLSLEWESSSCVDGVFFCPLPFLFPLFLFILLFS